MGKSARRCWRSSTTPGRDGAAFMDQRFGVQRLRPWEIEAVLANYEVVWLQEEAAGVAGWGGRDELLQRAADTAAANGQEPGEPAPALHYRCPDWAATRNPRRRAKRRFQVAMQHRWGWQALHLFMEVGFVDETVFGALQEAARSRQEQDASADPKEAKQRAAQAQRAKRLRRGASAAKNEARCAIVNMCPVDLTSV